mmetsp:Transcript_22283/g.26794  ORF Transcript_22283/g.26794 Transcript_22283/m.26794 type:complete len:276 (-) Transcript_22283:391-1218(-)
MGRCQETGAFSNQRQSIPILFNLSIFWNSSCSNKRSGGHNKRCAVESCSSRLDPQCPLHVVPDAGLESLCGFVTWCTTLKMNLLPNLSVCRRYQQLHDPILLPLSGVLCGHDHCFAVDSCQFGHLQVQDHHHLCSLKLILWYMLAKACDDLAGLVLSNLHLADVELITVLYKPCFLHHSHLHHRLLPHLNSRSPFSCWCSGWCCRLGSSSGFGGILSRLVPTITTTTRLCFVRSLGSQLGFLLRLALGHSTLCSSSGSRWCSSSSSSRFVALGWC